MEGMGKGRKRKGKEGREEGKGGRGKKRSEEEGREEEKEEERRGKGSGMRKCEEEGGISSKVPINLTQGMLVNILNMEDGPMQTHLSSQAYLPSL